MSRKPKQPDYEWSYPVIVEDLPSQGKSFEIAPTDAQKKAIAQRLGLVVLENLKAKIFVSRDAHIVHITGDFSAALTQSCVVSLEPLKSTIAENFEAWYADHEQVLSFKRAQHEAMTKKELADLPMLEEHEDPEPIENGQIDLGEIVTQYLSLSVNPYPQKEGVNYENKEEIHQPITRDALRPNPFAALKNWRPKD